MYVLYVQEVVTHFKLARSLFLPLFNGQFVLVYIQIDITDYLGGIIGEQIIFGGYTLCCVS